MNKLIVIPLGFMLVISIMCMVYGDGGSMSGDTAEYGGESTLTVNGSATDVDTGVSTEETFDLGGVEGAIVILTVAIAVGIAAGIKVLGSGISETSQKIIFMSVAYLGIWTCLTVLGDDLLFEMGQLGLLLWVTCTIFYVLGFASDVIGGAADF